jgi:hypothetical protein
MVVPKTDAFTPAPAVGVPFVTSGGHARAHAPAQLDLSPLSATHRYRAFPLGPTR